MSKLELNDLPMRVRVGRNLVGFNLPGKMSKDERIQLELRLLPAFDVLIGKYGGQVYSLTPDFGATLNPNLINEEQYSSLVENHIMFKGYDSGSLFTKCRYF